MGTPVRWDRRAFLLTGAAACVLKGQSAKGTVFDPDWKKFSDPTTEFEVFRLTNPAYTSRMPAYYGRAMTRNNGFMLFSSDRTGSEQAFRMDLKTGQCRQLTNATDLDAESVALMPGDRSFCYFDGPSLRIMNIATLREREVYKVPE